MKAIHLWWEKLEPNKDQELFENALRGLEDVLKETSINAEIKNLGRAPFYFEKAFNPKLGQINANKLFELCAGERAQKTNLHWEFALTPRDAYIVGKRFIYGGAGEDPKGRSLGVLLSSYRIKAPREIRYSSRHDWGHTVGLNHCEEPNCTMREMPENSNISKIVEQTERISRERGSYFCGDCQKKLEKLNRQ